jgi:hypothetical protein
MITVQVAENNAFLALKRQKQKIMGRPSWRVLNEKITVNRDWYLRTRVIERATI